MVSLFNLSLKLSSTALQTGYINMLVKEIDMQFLTSEWKHSFLTMIVSYS